MCNIKVVCSGKKDLELKDLHKESCKECEIYEIKDSEQLQHNNFRIITLFIKSN